MLCSTDCDNEEFKNFLNKKLSRISPVGAASIWLPVQVMAALLLNHLLLMCLEEHGGWLRMLALALVWETWVELQIAGFRPVQLWLLWAFGWKIFSLFLCLPLSVTLAFEWNIHHSALNAGLLILLIISIVMLLSSATTVFTSSSLSFWLKFYFKSLIIYT